VSDRSANVGALVRAVELQRDVASSREVADSWTMVDGTRLCHLSFGTFSADAAAGINLFDVLAHTWDIARSDAPLDEDDVLWEIGLAAARRVVGPDRDANHYGPELHAAPTASAMERFLALLGRSI
jgi:hypothetical protein